MSFLGLRRHVAAWLVPVGVVGLCGCDVLTDDPLTDSEVEAFLVEAATRAANAKGKAFQATVTAAASQRSTITETASLAQVKADATVEAAVLASRSSAVADDLSEAESVDLEAKQAALGQALQGEDVGAIRLALGDLTWAVASVESAVAARRPTPNPDQLSAPTVDSEQEDPSGRAEVDDPAQSWADGATSQSPSDAPADTTPSGLQDSADDRRDPPAGQERSQEP
ncbi:hypothetical protein [Actinomyces naeslundii]|uniref:hypothetical protein n=1 Tax=Actinomyces naeslundii TaxID=1655 RepID=UPI00096D65DE|nr:hypothetical protein [Actinomyces naeslundii]OMG10274.1 hypothetical protein BKH07_06645 [Actinomyces naeslundii]OMG17191.1 hypothetical protein BKH04_06045 [Actinomyces naeslundii]OMG22365.1 hypothetical protein BKH05_05600 [Actinomyces naeslundii]